MAGVLAGAGTRRGAVADRAGVIDPDLQGGRLIPRAAGAQCPGSEIPLADLGGEAAGIALPDNPAMLKDVNTVRVRQRKRDILLA